MKHNACSITFYTLAENELVCIVDHALTHHDARFDVAFAQKGVRRRCFGFLACVYAWQAIAAAWRVVVSPA
jgi:hypothetical protein